MTPLASQAGSVMTRRCGCTRHQSAGAGQWFTGWSRSIAKLHPITLSFLESLSAVSGTTLPGDRIGRKTPRPSDRLENPTPCDRASDKPEIGHTDQIIWQAVYGPGQVCALSGKCLIARLTRELEAQGKAMPAPSHCTSSCDSGSYRSLAPRHERETHPFWPWISRYSQARAWVQ